MASSSGASSGSLNGGLRTSGSEEHDPEVDRKRQRMQSNRESARRSQLRKQKHLDDLTDQVSQLRNHNIQIVANMNVVTNFCVSLEAKNSILQAQMVELTHRLKSLNDIIIFINSTAVFKTSFEVGDLNGFDFEDDRDYCNSWNLHWQIN